MNQARHVLVSTYRDVESRIGLDEGQPKRIHDHAASFASIYQPMIAAFSQVATSAVGDIVDIATERSRLNVAKEKERGDQLTGNKRALDQVMPVADDSSFKLKRSRTTFPIVSTIRSSTPLRRSS